MIIIKENCPDIGGICDSGQLFRMYRRTDGITFDLFAGQRHLAVRQQEPGGEIVFDCTPEEYEQYWKGYFDLGRDYKRIRNSIDPTDPFLTAAAASCGGISVLKQDVWETMISFIISQQKQIPSIRRCVEALCERFGEHYSDRDCEWFGFPSAEAIAAGGPDGLKGLSLGYRERYIYETAVQYLDHGIRDEELYSMSYENAKQYLCSFSGIGEKVANCILLFGAGMTDAFPIDVHIKDILYREYALPEEKNDVSGRDGLSLNRYREIIDEHFSRYKGAKGIIQQWIFAYELKKNVRTPR